MRKLQLLAPARDLQTALAAINCGADAIYMGGPDHGARAAAANSIDDITAVCNYAHQFGVKVYVTLNTLIYNDELADVERLVHKLYAAGVDALIVQDLGLLRMNLPPIALHASTQCDTRTPEKAEFLENLGMSCIVLPREFTLDQIRQVSQRVHVALEGFVHGALCVCYSGDCRASLVNGGRSANRGECAQICRLPYDLVDGDGNVIVADRHLLSLRDMNRLANIADLADAGITSFKIEGRLKSPDYVMNTVAVYSQALNNLCAAQPDKYCRDSFGSASYGFNPDINKSFNRGFTEYFLTNTKPGKGALSQPLTPKWIGEEVGIVTRVTPRALTARLKKELHNGDGLGYFDAAGKFTGFRLNRVDGNTLYPASAVNIANGTKLYRNGDKAFDDAMRAARPARRIAVDMTLRTYPRGLVLAITDERGCSIETAIECALDEARTPQIDARRRTLERLGNTIYTLRTLTDNVGNLFVPASLLTSLRTQAIDALNHAAAATRQLELRRPENADAQVPNPTLTFHDNVANRLARKLYTDHGAESVEPAIEVNMPASSAEVHVMTTRFCLRREMGACLKTADAKKLPTKLYLRPTNTAMRTMRIDCDCAACQMRLTALPL
jgi:putative protease